LFGAEIKSVPSTATVNIAFGFLSLLAGWAVGRHALLSAPGRAAAWSLLCLTLATATTLLAAGNLDARHGCQGWGAALCLMLAMLPQPFLLFVGSLLARVGSEPRSKADKGAEEA
jgi:hypothetical protein